MRSRTTLIIALLAASFITTAFIASRALIETVYHRATAERVIRDFASLAADEFVRGADAQISYYGCYPLVQKLAAGQPLPQSPLVRRAFLIDTNDATWRPRILDAIKRKSPVLRINGTTIYLGLPDRGALPQQIAALELEPRRFPFFFANVIRIRRLLPRSLAHGKLTNDRVFIRVLDGATPLFITPGQFDQYLGIRRSLTIDDGTVAGLTIEASIDRSIAPTLVLGGLPQVRLPLYATVLAINLLLLVTAVLQLRRERALARLRSDFISGVSHELRTPLTQIRMFAETLLLDRVRSDAERRRSLTIIDQETRRLSHLVENVLQFSRGERGTLRITTAPHDLAMLVRETADAFAPISKARGVTIDVDAAESIVDIDEDAIRQVVLNLLDNAIKYGPPDQRVIVRVKDRQLSVEDEGPGVPPNERERVFDRYRRLERERERAIAGMGIGLSVVRELVALHGGSVHVESGARGGARFVVTL